jgi:recombination protein RecT
MPPNEPAQNLIQSIRSRVRAVLPAGKDADHFLAVVHEYLIRNPDLLSCEKKSLEAAVVDAAILGLEPGPPLDLAVVVPYKDRDGQMIANLVVEYRGHMVQVYRSGKIAAIEARAVYQNDVFEFQFGKVPKLEHRPTPDRDRGGLVYAYAIATLTGGETAFEVVTRHDAEQAMKDSPGSTKPSSLWRKRTAEMWVKTAIKKLVARLPRTLPVNGRPGGGHDPPVPDYEPLFNAVRISPQLYAAAAKKLNIEFPRNAREIYAVVQAMRDAYKSDKRQPLNDPGQRTDESE